MNAEPINMKIPPQLIENYIQRRLGEIESLENAVRESDYSYIFKIGHQLKGNGLTFGFADISDIGAKLESSALIRNKSDIERYLREYRTVLDSIQKKH
jgi:HPt (histidine-containing phosphotransfer) domain-containing protein